MAEYRIKLKIQHIMMCWKSIDEARTKIKGSAPPEVVEELQKSAGGVYDVLTSHVQDEILDLVDSAELSPC